MSAVSSLCRLSLTIIFILVLYTGEGRADSLREVELVIDSGYPPYMMVEEGKPAGLYAEMLHEADKRLKYYTIKITAMPWKRAQSLVQSGKVAGLVGSYYKPTERPWVQYFSKSLFTEKVEVFCRNEVGEQHWKYPLDFAGLKFGNNLGFETPGPDFFDMVKMGRIKLEYAHDTTANLLKLQKKRIDCYVQDSLAVQMEMSRHGISGFRAVTEYRQETAHIGYGRAWVSRYADDFMKSLDRILVQMHEDGSLQQIVDRFLKKYTG